MTEFWLTYHFSSRAHLQPTTQLIELDHLEYKLVDLEDVLDYVFRQGFVHAKYRPATWWEKKDGAKVKPTTSVESLLLEGIGKCPDSALKLYIEDLPSTLWFSYVYLHEAHTQVVTQRVKLPGLRKRFERLGHVTNYIFDQGYLLHKYRPVVHWECPAGKNLAECANVDEILLAGSGVSEEKPLRLIIDNKHIHHHHHDHHDHHDHHHDHCVPPVPSNAKRGCGCL